MDPQLFASFSRRLQYARTTEDFDRLTAEQRELGTLQRRSVDDAAVTARA